MTDSPTPTSHSDETAANPGSDEAQRAGCKCPVMDNHHGQGMPYPEGPRFWINDECPLHGTGNTDVSASTKS